MAAQRSAGTCLRPAMVCQQSPFPAALLCPPEVLVAPGDAALELIPSLQHRSRAGCFMADEPDDTKSGTTSSFE